MIGHPSPTSFDWLTIRNNQIIGYIHPRNAELDVFTMVVIASQLWCPLATTTWSGQLHQHFQIDLLRKQINEAMWGHWILQKKVIQVKSDYQLIQGKSGTSYYQLIQGTKSSHSTN
jgi:hypothetical protein